MPVRITVRPAGRGWEVYVQIPEGRELLLGTRRSLEDARRLAEREARWWRNLHVVPTVEYRAGGVREGCG